MITIYVKKKRKEFVVHEKLISSADTFDLVFPSLHGDDESIKYLEDQTPEVISLLLNFLYRDTISNGNSQLHLDSLYNLYILGEEIAVEKLMDKTIDKIQDISLTYDKYIRLGPTRRNLRPNV